MNLDKLRKLCLNIKGIIKIRKARLKDGIILKYEPLLMSDRTFHQFTDFIHLDTWKDSLERTKIEHEKFFK